MSIHQLLESVSEHKVFGHRAAPVPPPQLSEPIRFPYGAFRFRTQLPKGTAYEILASADLKNWNSISRGTADVEPIEYVDSEAFKFSTRAYRVLAGEVYSRNVLGYVSFTLPPGFSMIANPLHHSTNRVDDLFKGWPDGTRLCKFDTRLFQLAENSVKDGKWTNPGEKLAPGDGALFYNRTSDYKAHSFVGEVLQGRLSVPIPAGFSVRSLLLPQQGSLEELGFPISNGDVIHLYDREHQQYVQHPYDEGKWTDGPPMIGLGESFWVAKDKPGNWVREMQFTD